jgi:hypothetical protein
MYIYVIIYTDADSGGAQHWGYVGKWRVLEWGGVESLECDLKVPWNASSLMI